MHKDQVTRVIRTVRPCCGGRQTYVDGSHRHYQSPPGARTHLLVASGAC